MDEESRSVVKEYAYRLPRYAMLEDTPAAIDPVHFRKPTNFAENLRVPYAFSNAFPIPPDEDDSNAPSSPSLPLQTPSVSQRLSACSPPYHRSDPDEVFLASSPPNRQGDPSLQITSQHRALYSKAVQLTIPMALLPPCLALLVHGIHICSWVALMLLLLPGRSGVFLRRLVARDIVLISLRCPLLLS